MNTQIWKREFTLEQLNEKCAHTLIENLGIVFTKKTAQSLEAEMHVDERTTQPFNLLHGGASATLGETLGSLAGYMCTEGDDNVVGLELNASHLRSVKNGAKVRGVCVPIRIGRSHQVWEIKIYDEQDQQICIVRHTTVCLSRSDK